MFVFLTVVQAIVAAALIGVILMQRSEGGGLGIGGSPGGMLSARGAADFLTRSTKWLAVAFVGLSIALAALAVEGLGPAAVDTTLDRTVDPLSNDPLAVPAPAPAPGTAPADSATTSPAPVEAAGDDPLAE